MNIGLNGGLTGKRRTTDALTAPGIWTLAEQILYKNNNTWPLHFREDPYFSNVSLLATCQGLNQSTNMKDLTANKSFSFFGDAKITTSQYKYYDSSVYLDGNQDYLFVNPDSSLDFGYGDFTMEFWARPLSLLVDNTIIDFRPGVTQGPYPTLQLGNNGTLRWIYLGAVRLITSSAIQENTWHHIAISRNAYTTRLFCDGVLIGSVSDSVNYVCPVGIWFGVDSYVLGLGYSNYFNGYLQDIRITKGIGRYTSTFTPPDSLIY